MSNQRKFSPCATVAKCRSILTVCSHWRIFNRTAKGASPNAFIWPATKPQRLLDLTTTPVRWDDFDKLWADQALPYELALGDLGFPTKAA